MYLDMGEWNLQPLSGITTAPVHHSPVSGS
jgi:hypothetical protein